MTTRRPTAPQPRVPGFATPTATTTGDAPEPSVAVAGRSGTRQLNVRLHVDLHDRYRRLLRDCEDAGLQTSMTELLHALLHRGPTDAGAVRELLRSWRRACGGDL